MLFNSYSFIFLFLPLTFAGMFWLGRYSHRLAALWLGLASLTFYAVWDSRFVLLLLGSIAFNYGAGYWIGLRRAADASKQASKQASKVFSGSRDYGQSDSARLLQIHQLFYRFS
ncbi:MAG: hypothetical protein PHW66_03300 [Gallionella sp.]|nr:hypothetical protein [Gallionella sp.]